MCLLKISLSWKKTRSPVVLGALDGAGDPEKGFVVRGGRMHEKHYECYWELLSHIPSLEDPEVSVRDESFEFNERFVSKGQARLLKDGKKIDVSSYGLSLAQEADFLKLTFVSEESLAMTVLKTGLTKHFLRQSSGTSGPLCSPFKNGLLWLR